MSRLYRFIPVLFLLYISQYLISYIYSQESGIFTYFTVRTCLASEPDSASGANVNPRGATPIKQTKDSRWIIYDRGDKTDWLKVSPLKTENKHLIIRFNFLRVVGTAIIEVYGADPSADFLEKREIEKAGLYEYIAQSVGTHYVKVYAADQGNLAQYEFSYELAPLSTSASDVTSVSSPIPTVTPTIAPTPTEVPTVLPTPLPTDTPAPLSTLTETPTVSPTPLPTNTPTPSPIPTSVPTASPTPLPTNTPTPSPIPTSVPTALSTPPLTQTETSIFSASDALSKSDFQIIGERYGVPFNLLRALSIVGSQNGRVPGDYEVRKVVNDEQLKFLDKIAEDTGRPISDFKGSSAGAMGYIQFLPATFYYYAQDGNGDGIKDPLNSYDSVATAAYFLAQKIAKEDSIEAALKSYSNNPNFYEKILRLYWELESEEQS